MKFMERQDDGLGAARGCMWLLIAYSVIGIIGIIVWLLVTVAKMWGG